MRTGQNKYHEREHGKRKRANTEVRKFFGQGNWTACVKGGSVTRCGRQVWN